jgi:hypothetical protein
MFGPSAVISALQTGATGPNLEHNLFCNNSRTACYIFKKNNQLLHKLFCYKILKYICGVIG